MTLQEIRQQLEEWKVNSKEEDNKHLNLLIDLVDHLVRVETSVETKNPDRPSKK